MIDFRKYAGKDVAVICNKFIYSGKMGSTASSAYITLLPPFTCNLINPNGFKMKTAQGEELTHLRTAIIDAKTSIEIAVESIEAIFEVLPEDKADQTPEEKPEGETAH